MIKNPCSRCKLNTKDDVCVMSCSRFVEWAKEYINNRMKRK